MASGNRSQPVDQTARSGPATPLKPLELLVMEREPSRAVAGTQPSFTIPASVWLAQVTGESQLSWARNLGKRGIFDFNGLEVSSVRHEFHENREFAAATRSVSGVPGDKSSTLRICANDSGITNLVGAWTVVSDELDVDRQPAGMPRQPSSLPRRRVQESGPN